MAGGLSRDGAAGGVRLLRTFVWLRWRVLVNGLTARRRSAWQRLGRIGELVARGILLLGILGTAIALAVLGGFLPWMLERASAELTESGFTRADALLLAVRFCLGLFVLLVLLVPAIQGLSGGGLPRTRLLLSPIRRRTLHAMEVGAHLGDPWLLAIVPALLTVGVAAVAVAGMGGLVVLAAGALFVLAIAMLSASVTFGVTLLLRDRRRAEAMALALMLLWTTVALLPSWLQHNREERLAEREAVVESPAEETAEPAIDPEPALDRERAARDARRERRLLALLDPPAVLQLVPSEAYARALGLAVLGRPVAALVPTGVLAATTLVLFGLSRLLWGRLLGSPAASGGRRGATELPRPPRVPGLSDAASVVAWGQLRGLSRTLAGRLALLVAPMMTLILASMLGGDLADMAPGGRPLGTTASAAILGAGAIGLSILSVQNLLVNLFAVDGPGFTLSALSPISGRDHVVGKWVAIGALTAGLVVLTTGMVIALAPEAVRFWPALLLGGLGVYCVLAPVGGWLSLLLPKAVDLGRLGKAAQPNQLAVLIGMATSVVVLALPLSGGFLVYALTRSALAVTVAEALWLLAALVLARLLLGPLARTLGERREAVFLALHERADG